MSDSEISCITPNTLDRENKITLVSENVEVGCAGCIFRLSEDSAFNKSHFIPAKTAHIVNACNNITNLSSAVFETESKKLSTKTLIM